jgi:hypothetical protein
LQPPPSAAGIPAPRKERFPSPAPLSQQELLLLRYATETPSELLRTAGSIDLSRKAWRVEPIEIAPLVVQELKVHPIEGFEKGFEN